MGCYKMSGKKALYRKLGFNKGDHTYKLTVPISAVRNLKLEPGQELYFENDRGRFTYYFKETKFSRKMKLQYQKDINTYSVRVPYRVVESLFFEPGQLFTFMAISDFFQFNPLNSSGKRIGVAPKISKVNNLPKCKVAKEGEAGGVNCTEV